MSPQHMSQQQMARQSQTRSNEAYQPNPEALGLFRQDRRRATSETEAVHPAWRGRQKHAIFHEGKLRFMEILCAARAQPSQGMRMSSERFKIYRSRAH